jgi:hypothetical protein
MPLSQRSGGLCCWERSGFGSGSAFGSGPGLRVSGFGVGPIPPASMARNGCDQLCFAHPRIATYAQPSGFRSQLGDSLCGWSSPPNRHFYSVLEIFY